jgi:hypothetical protein
MSYMPATPKKPKAKDESNKYGTVKTSVLIPKEMLDDLQKDADENERSLSAEIVFRLKQTTPPKSGT